MNDVVREKAVQFQLLEANLNSLKQKEQFAVRKLEELDRTKLAVSELKKGDALIPVGMGNFVHGKVTDAENIIIGIGAGIAVKRGTEDAKKILIEREEELKRDVTKINDEANHMVAQLQNLQKEIQELQSKK